MTHGSGNKPPQGNQPQQPGAPAWYQQTPNRPPSPFPQQPATPQPRAQPVQQPEAQQQQQPYAQAQPQQPLAQPGQGEAFGFQAQQQPAEEKYNTLYLAGNMQKERRRTQFIVIAIVVFALLGAILWISMVPESKSPEVTKPDAGAAAPAEDARAETPETEGETTAEGEP